MKNKIAFKLIIYFSATLILFSVIIGFIFMTLFRKHTLDLLKTDLEKRAVTISDTLSGLISMYTNQSGNGMRGGMMAGMQSGYGAYIHFLDEIAMADVWIVDENLQLITIGKMAMNQFNYADLPENAEQVVNEVFMGKTTFSEGFSELLNTSTLTVGTPITSNNKVVGAVLIHTPVAGMNDAVNQGFIILAISIFFALILSIILSIILALSFTGSLKKMKNTAIMLANGDYSAKTNVRQNDEIGELASTIDILSERLDSSSKEREKLQKLRHDFIANISHELRTPVTVLRGSLEALCDEIVTSKDQVKSYHQQMLKESKHLERLVNDLLDLSRLQNTDFNIEMEELNLCDVLTDIVRSAANIANSKNVKIRYEQNCDIYKITGDYGRLRQMFLIILDNAIKFSPENETVDVMLIDNSVYIKDRGIGITNEDLPYIFDRFYKVKSETNESGTGLGLSIAKQIADRHDIKLQVLSKLKEGTEFKFEFNN